jgi:hypothetical protein
MIMRLADRSSDHSWVQLPTRQSFPFDNRAPTPPI